MKNKLLLAVSAGVLAVTLSASANTISIDPISTSSDGSGGVFWDYPIVFNNSTVIGGSSFFNINDFGPLKAAPVWIGAIGVPPGAPSITTPLVGLNSGFVFGFSDNPAILDVQVSFTATAAVPNTPNPPTPPNYVLRLDSALTVVGGLANFSSLDQVTGGVLAGTPSQAQQLIRTPAAPTVPDGGLTVMLLGAALSGLGLIRRKLA